MTLLLAGAVGGITGALTGAALSWWVLGRAYDQGYRTGLTDQRPNPAQHPRAFRLPRPRR